MTVDLRGRSFLKEIDFTKEEFTYLIDRAEPLRGREALGDRDAAARRAEHRVDLREDVDPDAFRLRGRRARPGGPRHLPRPRRLPARPQGVDEGHGARPRPDVRRDRVPGLRPGERRDSRPIRRRPGVERPDRPVASDPDAGRRAHDARPRARPSRRWRYCYLGDARNNTANSLLVTGALLGAGRPIWPHRRRCGRPRRCAPSPTGSPRRRGHGSR